MSIQNYVDMTIESDIFAGARDSFDLMMQKLLHKMQQNASDEGSITLKVSVDMTTEWIPDGNGESEECFKPKIKYKVDYAVPVKEGQDGKKDPGMKLVYDVELRRYVLKYVNEGGQMSMFDSEFQEAEAEDVTESDVPAIEGPVSDQNALPDNSEEEESEEPEETDIQEESDSPEDSMTPPDDIPDDYGYDEPDVEDDTYEI